MNNTLKLPKSQEMMKPEKEKEMAFEKVPPVEQGVQAGAEPETAGAGRETGGAGPDDYTSVENLLDELETARRAAAENEDLYLRERAELENFRKRSLRERSESLRYAIEPLARDLVGVVDNLERALDHARASGDSSPVVEGVELVLKGALETLHRHGVQRIEAAGQEFDPAFHEAVAQVADDSLEANRVVQQFVPGYRLHERLLRAAQVSVSTGPAQRSRSEQG